MILEYLTADENKADACVAIIDQTEATSNKKQLNESYYIVTASLKSDSDKSAISLSKLHEDIIAAIDCTVLTDESSAYHDRVLYPLINEFERKLRKLLYSASALNDEDNIQISNLESKDFGELFALLFRDDEYWKNVKAFVNGQKRGQSTGWQGFAGELQGFLKAETEQPLWDRLLPGKAPLLRKKFSDVQKYRNDVMHAHYIRRKDYLQIKRLFENINAEIDGAIEGLANGALVPETYNEDLGNALAFLIDSKGDFITDHEGNRITLSL